eukprot:scaffold185481_cov114-Cyclotella_meneghiniana.AAC.2
MLLDLLRVIYIDPEELVVKEYLVRCSAWKKKENTVESLKYFNLERMIAAAAEEERKDAPMPLEMEEYYSVEIDQVNYDNEE